MCRAVAASSAVFRQSCRILQNVILNHDVQAKHTPAWYERLRMFSQQAGFDDEAAWLTRRLAYLKSGR